MGVEEPPSDVSSAIRDVVNDDGENGGRAHQLQRLAGTLVRSGRDAGVRAVTNGRWLADLVLDLAPHVPLRDLATLYAHHPGLDDDALAEQLVRNASLATASIGAVGGGIASVQTLAPPSYLGVPVQLAAETLGIVAIELKLIAELHEIYGQPIAGTVTQRAAMLGRAWTERRGVGSLANPADWTSAAIPALRQQLARQIARRFLRSGATLIPFLVGSAVGAELNRRATRWVGDAVVADLRSDASPPPLVLP